MSLIIVCFHCVKHKHRYRHRADPAGDGRYCGDYTGHLVRFHVAAELLLFLAPAYADVNDGLPGREELGAEAFGPSAGGDDDAAPSADGGEVLRFAVAERDRCVALLQKHSGGKADDSRAADNGGEL